MYNSEREAMACFNELFTGNRYTPYAGMIPPIDPVMAVIVIRRFLDEAHNEGVCDGKGY